MKTLICYSSKTGNTAKIAQAIQAALPHADLHSVDENPDPDNYELIFVGFWVDKGTADDKAKKYMQRLNQQTVALFATLGANPDSQHARDSLNKAAQLIPAGNIVARFICQGAIDPKLTARMSTMPEDHPHAPDAARIKRWQEAKEHPNSSDCANAAHWATTIVKKLSHHQPTHLVANKARN
ncbi:MAG: flavodoxin family protein [Desulfuromonas sp.]|nr:flavodoxin family protein [Desulfuromonas sp.]